MSLSSTLGAPAVEHARTGRIGRLVRLLLALAVGVFAALRLATFAHRGPMGYRDPSVLTDPSFWILTAIVLFGVVDFAGRFALGIERFSPAARRIATLTVLLGAAVIAAAIGVAQQGAVWGFPLADLSWWVNTGVLVELTIAFGLAGTLGTPGCEQGVWRELFERRGAGEHSPLSCVIGLHALDSWEANRSRRGGE
jgi:hypothetical protein